MDKTNALSLTGGGMFDGGWTPVWLIKDEFTDTVAAGSVNGTAATPGPGTRTVTDTESKTSVGGGALVVAGGASVPGFGNPGIWYDAQTRAAGLAAVFNISGAAVATGELELGWDTGQTGVAATGIYAANGAVYAQDNFSLVAGVATIANGQDNKIIDILRSTGNFVFVQSGGNWELAWVGVGGNGATMYPAISNKSVAFDAAYLRVVQLPSPFNGDDGIATDVLNGSVSAGTTFTHEANALIEATIATVPSADNIDIVFRQQDASNYWICRIATGGDISLQEVVAGTPTQRGVAAGVVSNGHRVVIVADGTTIKGYSNNTLRWTYSSASNFATATAGELNSLGTGGAVSDLKTWPRTLSGTAASILNKASG